MPQRDVSTQRNNRKEQANSTRWWGVGAAALATRKIKIVQTIPKSKNKNKNKKVKKLRSAPRKGTREK